MSGYLPQRSVTEKDLAEELCGFNQLQNLYSKCHRSVNRSPVDICFVNADPEILSYLCCIISIIIIRNEYYYSAIGQNSNFEST